jgi:3-oxoacyl-[acyl-carrier protein] reductase
VSVNSRIDFGVKGRHALVCGASAGIGRAAALALADLGAHVTALARSESSLRELVTEIQDQGGSCGLIVADLDDRESLCDNVAGLLAEKGPIHILVNNSGGPPSGPLLGASEADLIAPFGRHVLSSHLLTQMLLPGMKEAGYGRIINVISTSVREPIPGLGVSNTIRGAMASWAKSISRELPPGITINNVLPGFTDTARLTVLGEAVAERSGTSLQEVREMWLSDVPEARLAQPSEIAAAIAFLASPAGAFVRGTSMPVDGGRLRSI